MTAWFVENLGTIIVALILAGIIITIVVSMIKSRRKGTSCSCGGCCHCSMCESCSRSCSEQGND